MADDPMMGIPKSPDFRMIRQRAGDGPVLILPHPKTGEPIPALSANWTFTMTQQPEDGSETVLRIVMIAEEFVGLPCCLSTRMNKFSAIAFADSLRKAAEDLPDVAKHDAPEPVKEPLAYFCHLCGAVPGAICTNPATGNPVNPTGFHVGRGGKS